MKDEIYTATSCLGNPGPGGWAVILSRTGKIISGGENVTTDNRMKMMAIIYALEESNEDSIIYTDSIYCKNGFTEPKKTDDMDRDLLERIWVLYTLRKPDVQWVKGSSKATKQAQKALSLVVRNTFTSQTST